MTKLTADIAKKIYSRSQNRIYDSLQSIVDEIVRTSESRGTNTFIDLAPENLKPFAKELEERGFRVWIREDKGYLEVEW